MRVVIAWFFVLLGSMSVSAQTTRPDWVHRSDENARVLLDVLAQFEPEDAAAYGIGGLDDQIIDLTAGYEDRWSEANEKATGALRQRLAGERDENVRLDLEILIGAAEREAKGRRLRARLELPYVDVAEMVFFGVRTLLNDQVEPARRPAALRRLKRYVGLDQGCEPLVTIVADRLRARMGNRDLIGPVREKVETDLAHDAEVAAEIGGMFERFHIEGADEAIAKLKEQIAGQDEFVREHVLPRARQDFRLPAELYAFQLEEVGVDMPGEELRNRSATCFRETQTEMESLAPLVAKEKGFAVSDYRGVMRELKKSQITGEAIKPHFESRIRAIEEIIRREKVVTLPARAMRFRVASEAESVMHPAPHFDSPRLIDNHGEQGEFVLPLRIGGRAGEASLSLDDFTFDAYTWTLTAHEGRPGHDLQFAALSEQGVSLARSIYAYNSVNTEGWALYCEAEMRPYWPLEGQLAALQARLLRAARAILDPGLQDGSITRAAAMRLLREDVCLSEGAALQEVQRYTFRAPGQATSYFCGYQRLMEMRADAERMMGSKFDRQKYHDFILSQGLLPPKLLRQAVMKFAGGGL